MFTTTDLVTPEIILTLISTIFCCKATNAYIRIVMMVILNDDGVTGRRLFSKVASK